MIKKRSRTIKRDQYEDQEGQCSPIIAPFNIQIKVAPRVSRHCRELRIPEDGTACGHSQAWASVQPAIPRGPDQVNVLLSYETLYRLNVYSGQTVHGLPSSTFAFPKGSDTSPSTDGSRRRERQEACSHWKVKKKAAELEAPGRTPA
jgi:hypothetical protein